MIKQSFIDDGILEKKYKILRTSIMLGNFKNRSNIMSEYEDTAREIDKMKKDVYEELLASKMYETTTLEEERDRLEDLISCIDKRITEKNDFVDDYIKITSNYLDNLDSVSFEEELPNYRERFNNINEYLLNVEEINTINEKLEKLKVDLEEKYNIKSKNELINSKLEEELINEFNKIITKNEYYTSLNYTDIDDELVKIEETLKDKKDVMDTFTSSYNALSNVGISGAEREEYLSYVQDSRKEYYAEIEKKFILDIYKLVLAKESDYDKLYQKRLQINDLINQRYKCRSELEIETRDDIEYFADLCQEQFNVIRAQKINLEDIDKIIIDITNSEDRLSRLEEANNREEILKLLEEFSVEKTTVNKFEFPEEKENIYDKTADDQVFMKKPDNMVVKISEPVKMNVKVSSDTAKLVMKKVVIVLEPKKFNTKKDKLKEAEKELEERKKQEEIFKDESGDELFNDIPNIVLDTKDKENDQIKINLPDKDEISIPTEIFIDEEEKQEINLFSETDPFLDDNQFEIDNNKNGDITDSNMPTISKIGSVKPNNMLSKIEDVEKENEDIILPTMGLGDSSKGGVPIVSENYIN